VVTETAPEPSCIHDDQLSLLSYMSSVMPDTNDTSSSSERVMNDVIPDMLYEPPAWGAAGGE
jgi:hypothetical protein